MGVRPDNHDHIPRPKPAFARILKMQIPDHFDAREKWVDCPSIRHIVDQGACGSCWAVAATTAISDRLCIHSNGRFKAQVSAAHLLSCSMEDGCQGGYPDEAWKYWTMSGLVTGGDYGKQEGCLPYEIIPCEHHVNGTRLPCKDLGFTPECRNKCTNPMYKVPFEQDKTYGLGSYTLLEDEDEIKIELMTNGPIEAAYEVFEDFLNYKSGVYQYYAGSLVGGHAVRILGWGIDNLIPYWLIANSWNSDWGDNGTFRILRGQDHCGIESSIVAGIPKV